MSLVDGCRISIAPRFWIEPAWDWSERLRINSGVREEDGRYFPRPDWRRATDSELLALVERPNPLPLEFPLHDLCLFAITERMRCRFWSMAAGGLRGPAGEEDWFLRFTRELAEFARFKALPLPNECAFDLKVSEPRRPSTRIDETAGDARLGGLDLDDPDSGPRPLGGINLGHESTALVVLNLGPARIRERLAPSEPPEAAPTTHRDLARRFFNRFPLHPLVRVTLRPGEGYWLPGQGLIFDGDATDVTGIDVRLEIRMR